MSIYNALPLRNQAYYYRVIRIYSYILYILLCFIYSLPEPFFIPKTYHHCLLAKHSSEMRSLSRYLLQIPLSLRVTVIFLAHNDNLTYRARASLRATS